MKWEKYGQKHSICEGKYENHPNRLRYPIGSETFVKLYAGSGASLHGHNKMAKVRILSDWKQGNLYIWLGAHITDDIAEVEVISNNYRIPSGCKMNIGYHQIIGYFSNKSWNDLDGWMRSNL